MVKGKDTKLEILKKGLDMASQVGLEAVTIGSLAKVMNMSKSGLFAHFNSKENLQIQILNHAGQLFSEQVVLPALKIERGIPRIRAVIDNWIEYSAKLGGGCIFVSSSIEFSDRPGNVRSLLLCQQQQWLDSLRRIGESAVKAGDFKADSDCDQFAYDLYSLLLGFHYYSQLLHDPNTHKRKEKSLKQLIQTYGKASN
jgi:AcrR family transcriptional regulator